MPKKRFGKAKMKKMWCSFRPWFSSGLWHFVLINKNWKMYETAIPMGKMLNAFLAIHGRCKFIIFLRGQTPSLSAPTLIVSLMEHCEGKAKNTVKQSIKSTFSISIQTNCNWLPGNPQLPPRKKLYDWCFTWVRYRVEVQRSNIKNCDEFYNGWLLVDCEILWNDSQILGNTEDISLKLIKLLSWS